ncbi:V-type ATP synthase subunit C [Methanolacinia petrolearia]|uniref:V-type ATP synthase subunit C n=1 Tax=Methanolacinia petrolearia TaxID=54120 RepID=UPI003BA92E33
MAAVNTTGPAPYIYACTRMKVRKASLIPREEYMRMLNMELPEIARIIEETHYKAEIDELNSSFSGINLFEIALSWNLAKDYQRVIAMVPGHLKGFTKCYLLRWDIQNVLTIMRGKSQGVPQGRIKEITIPAGSLDKAALDKLIADDSVDRIVENLRGHELYPVFEREMAGAVESGSFARMENELYKAYYADIIHAAKSGVKGGYVFLQYIRLAIDTKNLMTVFRVKGSLESDDLRELMIPGGTFSVDELVRLAGSESSDEIIETIRNRLNIESFTEVLEKFREEKSVHKIETALTKAKLAQLDKLAKRYQFSVCPILLYLELKQYEVSNIRAVARGKASKLDAESIEACMVV